jgi:psiF repeat
MWKFAAALSLAALLTSGSVAVAQKKEKAPAKPRSAASSECSKQADAKGLHGKVRKKFRSKCMRELRKA